MVFTTTNLFKGIPCPEGERCKLTSCIYGHDLSKPKVVTPVDQVDNPSAPRPKQGSDGAVEPASKRRRVAYESLANKPPSRADEIRSQLASARTNNVIARDSIAPTGKVNTPSSLKKPVSPPEHPNKAVSTTLTKPPGVSDKQSRSKPAVEESLNPRLIPNDPAGHTKRALYLKHLHAEMQRANRPAEQKANGQGHVDDTVLIRMALDEEEKVAREQSALYANIIKTRIAVFRKMSHDEWIKYADEKLNKNEIKPVKDKGTTIDTGLTADEEVCILPQLVIDQKPLVAHGYIPIPPTAEEAAEAAAAVEASKNYEVCDRCAARFQVFPDRNEAGDLTSAGPCQFHPSRKVFPPRSKADRETGPKEAYFPCCHQPIGSDGCATHPDHVFKTTSPARLAVTVPFIYTPDNPRPAADRHGKAVKAVTFDCEMGYTTRGMELIRLTAVAWPGNEALLDVLVRPVGTVIDLNSRYSGVFPEHYQNAVPYGQWSASKASTPADPAGGVLPIVENPAKARELLCRFLTPDTPLIGHAIENDLNATRLCHPTVIDTIVLFPHPRGLPMRNGLKMLSQKFLDRFIQTGGERGHDSLEDAVATGDLVRVKVRDVWKKLRLEGWKFVLGQLVKPPSSSLSDGRTPHGLKRRKGQGADGADGSTDDERS